MKNIFRMARATAKTLRCSILHPTYDEYVVANVYGNVTHLQRHTICEKCGDLDAETFEFNLAELVGFFVIFVGLPLGLLITVLHVVFHTSL